MKAEQEHLEGMAPPKNLKIQDAIEAYVNARDARIALGKGESKLKAALMGVMKEEGLEEYNVDGYEAHIERGEETVKAKVKILAPPEPDEDPE